LNGLVRKNEDIYFILIIKPFYSMTKQQRIFTLICLLLGLTQTTYSQTVFKEFEVTKTAQPQGGYEYLNSFIMTNLRVPFQAEIDHVSGRVFVQGVVGADGKISNVSLLRGLRPDCDREALRVFKLFNAWQPAEKDSQKVAQVITQAITFKTTSLIYYQDGYRVTYYDNQLIAKAETDSSVVFKQTMLADTNGYPTGDLVFYERKRDKWREKLRYKFYDQARGRSMNIADTTVAERWFRRLSYKSASGDLQGNAYTLYDNGSLAGIDVFDAGRLVGKSLNYYPNGLVAKLTTHAEESLIENYWYPNGQIWKTESKPQHERPPTAGKETTMPEPRLLSLWDSTGHQDVKEGNGYATLRQFIKSRLSDKYTILTEKGTIADGLKTGTWTGRYADGAYFYQDEYVEGKSVGGKAKEADKDTIRYKDQFIQPEFKGGLPELGRFLGTNIRYPADAQRARAQGRVFISFVVCEDGSLCDHEVVKSAGNQDLDNEALRVVKQMNGKWTPGVQRGRKVRVKYNLPVNFTFQ
jgi:TonB family protein